MSVVKTPTRSPEHEVSRVRIFLEVYESSAMSKRAQFFHESSINLVSDLNQRNIDANNYSFTDKYSFQTTDTKYLFLREAKKWRNVSLSTQFLLLRRQKKHEADGALSFLKWIGKQFNTIRRYSRIHMSGSISSPESRKNRDLRFARMRLAHSVASP